MLQDTQPSDYGITHSPSYWFPDGNIVLQIESTQYRVHKSLLGRAFPVFEAASEFTRPGEIEDVEGCQVAKLEGDKMEDWENVLLIVYAPFLNFTSTNNFPIPVILSTLRLASKYLSDHLRDMAATCLRNLIPCSLDSWREVHKIPAFVDDLFDIIEVALGLGMYSILPGAYLLCMRYMGLEKILNGFKRTDGSISSLSPSTVKTLLLGRQALLDSAIQYIINSPMIWKNAQWCKKSSEIKISHEGDTERYDCDIEARENIHNARVDHITKNPAEAFHCTMLIIWTYRLCEECVDPIEYELGEGQIKLWDKLPSFFGLPAWGEVDDFILLP